MQRVDIENFRDKKIALVLSGGVVKAATWHLGVALALEELGIQFKHNNSGPSSFEISTYVGSSAGSLINLYLASGFRPLDVIEATIEPKKAKFPPIGYREILSTKRPMKIPPRSINYGPFDGLPLFVKQMLLPLTQVSGLFSTYGLKEYLIKNVMLSENFKDYAADMFVVATQLDHSRKVIFGKYHYPNPGHDPTSEYYTNTTIGDAVAASMSVPPFYTPYPIENKTTKMIDYYIDGEIRETLSTHVAIDNQAQFIISSWTHTPYHFTDEVGSLASYGLPAVCLQAINLLVEKKIISSRAKKATAADIIDTVNEYLKGHRFPEEHRRNLLNILERKLDFRKNIHLIDIFPKHKDYSLFFRNYFSLHPSNTSPIITAGYKRTMEVFKNHEWES